MTRSGARVRALWLRPSDGHRAKRSGPRGVRVPPFSLSTAAPLVAQSGLGSPARATQARSAVSRTGRRVHEGTGHRACSRKKEKKNVDESKGVVKPRRQSVFAPGVRCLARLTVSCPACNKAPLGTQRARSGPGCLYCPSNHPTLLPHSIRPRPLLHFFSRSS